MGIAARIAAAVLSMGLASSDKERRSEDKEERDKKTDEKRQQEADRMRAAIEALKTAGDQSGRILARGIEKAAATPLATQAGRLVGKIPGMKALNNAVTPGWKTKAVGVAATGAAGLAGYKGLSALRNYASTEPGDMSWGAKRNLKHNVNEYGYPSS